MLFAAVTIAVFVVVTLLGLEVTLWLAQPGLGYNGRCGGVQYTWGHKVVNNRLGFRERDFAMPKPDGMYRVMVLGDSLTWGEGLAVEDRYTARLEALMQASRPTQRIEVLNFGLRGGSTTHERDVLNQHVDAVDPDLVIVGFCLNDPQPKSQRYSVEGNKFQPLFWIPGLLRRLCLHRSALILDRGLANLLSACNLMPSWQVALQRTYELDSPEWRQFVEALADIKQVCNARRLPPPIFAILNQGTNAAEPTDYNDPDDKLKTFLRWYDQVQQAASDAGMVTIRFDEEFATQLAGEPLGVNPLDDHPSARCNEVYAEKLAKLIGPMFDGPMPASAQ